MAVYCVIVFVSCLLILAGAMATASARSDVDRIGQSARPSVSESGKKQAEQIDVLEPGKPLEREIAGGEAHSYRLTLAAGQFCRVVVDQRDIDVVITVYDLDGKEIVEVDSNDAMNGPEPVSLVVETSGNYRLEVRPLEKKAPTGRYEVKIEELRATTAQDKSRMTAQKAFADAISLSNQKTAGSLHRAIEKFQEAISLWQSLGDRSMEARALNRIGLTYHDLSEYQKALDHFNRALPLTRAAGDRRGEAETLTNSGLAYADLSEWQKALDYYNRALKIHREMGDRRTEADTLVGIGYVYNYLGDRQKAFDFYNESLSFYRVVGDRYRQAATLHNMGHIFVSVSEYQKALDTFNQALPLWRDVAPLGEAATLSAIGGLYVKLGEYQKALDHYNQALPIQRAVGDRRGEALSLGNIALTYSKLGKFQEALNYNQQALATYRDIGDRRTEALIIKNISKVYDTLGDRQKALEFINRALTIQREIGDRPAEAISLNSIGDIYSGLGDYQQALDHYNRALPLMQSFGDRSGEADTLYDIARAQRHRNNFIEAREAIEAALAISETLRNKVASQELRTSYFASVQNYYELGIDLLMRLHKQRPAEGLDAAALQASEKGRARSLLELITEAGAEIRQGVDPALLERERALRQRISDKAERQMRLLSGKHTAEQATAAAREIAALTTEYEQIQGQIRETSPRYAALTQPVPLGLKEIQQRVLDDQTLLLEYALGEEKSYLWAVTPTSISSFELPKRAEIERAARQVYELLIARNQNLPNETPERKRRRWEQADADYPKASAILSQMLLGPVASELKDKRLLVVSDGMLQYVPFAALPVPQSGRDEEARRGPVSPALPLSRSPAPLIVHHEIVSLPSASVVAVLRQETAGRQPVSKMLAVLADPVFSTDDPRVRSSGKDRAASVKKITPAADAIRSAREAGLADLARLRFSRLEADEITRLVMDKMKLEALDFAANRALATSGEMGQYRIVHFATHGLINNQHPELSGVVLSLVDEQGRPQNGFLRLYDIYNLKLGVEIVVLSACQTALGKEVKGEGLVGLTRGFMYSGAPRVVASLWRIDDRATADLMKRFYQAMLGEGLRPAAALRAAQVSMWKERRWQAPHYWAAITFQGEWK
jgi:CHAT domain-containing protein/Tfp pilus assembly protein PilF